MDKWHPTQLDSSSPWGGVRSRIKWLTLNAKHLIWCFFSCIVAKRDSASLCFPIPLNGQSNWIRRQVELGILTKQQVNFEIFKTSLSFALTIFIFHMVGSSSSSTTTNTTHLKSSDPSQADYREFQASGIYNDNSHGGMEWVLTHGMCVCDI